MADERRTEAEADMTVDDLLREMTLEEKASLTVGRDFWRTRPIERLGIPSIWLADGPTGLRKSPDPRTSGIGQSIPATCFPTESALAASWNPALIREIGRAVGEEAQAEDVQVVLAPGVNLKRSPLGGRNFEYFSEDPVLSGEMAAAYIEGVQSQGVGTSLKHFVANEQETGRMYADSLVDERTLREVYLRSFEIAVRTARPWTVMAAYNMLNGTYCTENRYLLHDILKREWGFEGIVMSDWIAVNDRVAGIKAGCHLQMPGAPTESRIVEAVRAGDLEEDRLDEIVRELLAFILRAHAARKTGATYDAEAHQRLARRAAGQSITLLKNDGGMLPLSSEHLEEVAIIGAFARSPRYQGGGSSEVVPTRVENVHDELLRLAGDTMRITFAPGYGEEDTPDPALLEQARGVAGRAAVAVLFVGLPATHEMEGVDRHTIALPRSHDALIEAVLEVQPKVAVVLTNGSAVAMPWVHRVPAIVESWLAGQAGGGAIAEVLLGHVSPSGKLSETFPLRLEDIPPYPAFPAQDVQCRYTEDLFTGYRWYDTRKITPLFPFGHGLSYTTFDYSDLSLSTHTLGANEELAISLRIRNSGERAGQEVAQLYIHAHRPALPRPECELRAFSKVALEPGEQREITFRLGGRDFAHYDPAAGAWVVGPGRFDILVGASSRDTRLADSVMLEAAPVGEPFTRLTPLRVWIANPITHPLVQPALRSLARSMGAEIEDGAKEESFVNDFMLDMPIAKLVVMGCLLEKDLARFIDGVNVPKPVM